MTDTNNEIQLIKADCLSELSKIPSNTIDLVLTDPPYSGLNSKSRGAGRFNQMSHHIDFDDMSERAFLLFIKPIFAELYRVMKVGSHFYCFTDWKQLRNMADCLELASLKLVNIVCWDKGHFGTGSGYRSQAEYVLVFSKGMPNTFNLRNIGNVIKCPRVTKNVHPHQKPVELLKTIIQNSTQPGDTVLDPFVGSGSTAVASVELARRCIGIDVDQRYIDIASDRLRGLQTQQSLGCL